MNTNILTFNKIKFIITYEIVIMEKKMIKILKLILI